MQTAYTVLILLMLVSVSRLVGRVIPLPLPLVQIAAGALLAWPTLGLHVALDPELFLFLFLPPLLFADGWRIPKRELWRLRGPVVALAVGLVLFTVVGAGYFIHWLMPSIPLPVAFALAAVSRQFPVRGCGSARAGGVPGTAQARRHRPSGGQLRATSLSAHQHRHSRRKRPLHRCAGQRTQGLIWQRRNL